MCDDGETKCRRCGLCCRYKFWLDGELVFTDKYCQFHDKETHTCKVYDHRHEATRNRCLSREEMVKQRSVPTGCPYTDEDYVGPREPTEKELQDYHDDTEGAT